MHIVKRFVGLFLRSQKIQDQSAPSTLRVNASCLHDWTSLRLFVLCAELGLLFARLLSVEGVVLALAAAEVVADVHVLHDVLRCPGK